MERYLDNIDYKSDNVLFTKLYKVRSNKSIYFENILKNSDYTLKFDMK